VEVRGEEGRGEGGGWERAKGIRGGRMRRRRRREKG
jgi:hypothetical protein